MDVLCLKDWVMNTTGRCAVPVCMWRWWSLSDDSAWGSWSRWQSPRPCPPPSSSCGHRGSDAPAASQPAHQKAHSLRSMFPVKSFRNVSKVVRRLQKFNEQCKLWYICRSNNTALFNEWDECCTYSRSRFRVKFFLKKGRFSSPFGAFSLITQSSSAAGGCPVVMVL